MGKGEEWSQTVVGWKGCEVLKENCENLKKSRFRVVPNGQMVLDNEKKKQMRRKSYLSCWSLQADA